MHMQLASPTLFLCQLVYKLLVPSIITWPQFSTTKYYTSIELKLAWGGILKLFINFFILL